MKLIFHYGDLYRHHPQIGSSFLLPRCFLIGQLTGPYVVEPTGTTGIFMVRFHPNGFLPFTTIPIHEMENTAVPLENLFGEKGREMGIQIIEAANQQERIERIEAFLLGRLSEVKTQDRIVNSTLDILATANGQLSINDLSEQANQSRRVLARKYSTSVGLSPKQLSKIIRLQSSLKSLLKTQNSKLTRVAHEHEYFDQAHFIKDFKEFTGLTPKEFYGDHFKMSLIFESGD
ncbi:helix-turn-helix transcriptional regulator [bacterium SCSIO 12741]|nr:helix-turn-helix transcriptional regulator [bacterium SCSIO 12741]